MGMVFLILAILFSTAFFSFLWGYIFAGGIQSLPELIDSIAAAVGRVIRFAFDPLQPLHRSRYPILLRQGSQSLELCVTGDWSVDKIEKYANDEYPIPGVQRWQCNIQTDAVASQWHDVHQCTRCRGRRHVKLSAC